MTVDGVKGPPRVTKLLEYQIITCEKVIEIITAVHVFVAYSDAQIKSTPPNLEVRRLNLSPP